MRFFNLAILTAVATVLTSWVAGQDKASMATTVNEVGDAVDSAVSQPVGEAQDFAGDVLIDGNNKAVKSGVTAFNALGRVLKAPGNMVFDSIYGINEPLTNETLRPKIPVGDNSNEPIVVMAVSGGGSRMAYYHANLMEELSKIPDPWGKKSSLLDRIDVISGVSGGSWSSAWYVANYHRRHDPGFFEDFKNAMNSNVQFRGLTRLALYPPETVRILTSSRTRTDTVAEVLGRTIDGKNKLTFDDLNRQWFEAPANEKPPVLITNATILNNGGRLAMTNLPPSQLPASMGATYEKVFKVGRHNTNLPEALKPVHFEDFGSNIGTFRVGDAVAASASYPIFLPPYNLKVYRDRVPADVRATSGLDTETLRSPWLQVSDGGLYSNDALDSLYSFVKTLPKSRPVVILFVYSHDLDVRYTNRDRSWFIPAVINRMFSLNNNHLRVHQYFTMTTYRSLENTGYIFFRLHGSTPKEEKRIKNIPTAFTISKSNRKLIEKVTPDIVSTQKPLIDAVSKLCGGKISSTQYFKILNTIDEKVELNIAED